MLSMLSLHNLLSVIIFATEFSHRTSAQNGISVPNTIVIADEHIEIGKITNQRNENDAVDALTLNRDNLEGVNNQCFIK